MENKATAATPAKRFLVTYADGSLSQQAASAILNVDDATVHRAENIMATDAILNENDVVHFDSIGVSSLSLTDEQAQKLQERPEILAVEEDKEMFALNDVLTDKAPGAWAKGYKGKGVKVAVLDTGVAPHPDLVIAGGISFVPGVSSYNDGHGHGTHCCGVVGAKNNTIGVVGVAPECTLYAVKVLSDAGNGPTSAILAGMVWAKNNGIKVVSMSLGSLSEPSIAYTMAIKQLNDAGVTVVCAAGNSYTNSVFPWVNSPGNSPGAIAVGAVDAQSAIAYFSSRGGKSGVNPWNQVTLVGPGVNVNSSYKNGGYTSMSGTSMATPHVAGAVALIKQRFPNHTPAQIKALLQSSATDLGPAGTDVTYGAGLLNCEKAVL
ncbi:MAG: peptidase S8 [Sphingobacteriaceae bacterium]|nr:MAG: peptidase S8 [Sphingobacteriaceae bacterium]